MQADAPARPLALPEPDAARLLGISAKSLGRLAREGKPVGRVKLGNRVVYRVSDLDAYLADQVAEQAVEPADAEK